MTTQITLDDYWIGRDKKYAKDITDVIRSNAEITVSKVNLLLFVATKGGYACCQCPSRNAEGCARLGGHRGYAYCS